MELKVTPRGAWVNRCECEWRHSPSQGNTPTAAVIKGVQSTAWTLNQSWVSAVPTLSLAMSLTPRVAACGRMGVAAAKVGKQRLMKQFLAQTPVKFTQAHLPTAFVSPALVSTGSEGQQGTSQGWRSVNGVWTDGTWGVTPG